MKSKKTDPECNAIMEKGSIIISLLSILSFKQKIEHVKANSYSNVEFFVFF